jgi:hypothetical protein
LHPPVKSYAPKGNHGIDTMLSAFASATQAPEVRIWGA